MTKHRVTVTRTFEVDEEAFIAGLRKEYDEDGLDEPMGFIENTIADYGTDFAGVHAVNEEVEID
ncbi:hypothetical protein LCGC14_3047460 [marine sediment metagenome]|uniref:Uncharacterized protein n=1 Tax=marine sediment metagenome TaxID=412755 RepID=A0A0F8XAY1_9ZZZZ